MMRMLLLRVSGDPWSFPRCRLPKPGIILNAKMCFQLFMLITVQPFHRLAVDHLGEDADLRAVPTPAPLACSRSASLCRLAKSRSYAGATLPTLPRKTQ